MDLYPLKCLVEGTTWVVSLKVKLEDGVTGDGVYCDPSVEGYTGCPYIWLRVVKTTGQTFDMTVRDYDMAWDPDEWNSFKGHVTITPDFGSNIEAIHTIFTGGPVGSVLLLDDLAWTPTTAIPTTVPTSTPTKSPSTHPTVTESVLPSYSPSAPPTLAHSVVPSASPTYNPTSAPSVSPTISPSDSPTADPCGNMMLYENGENDDPLSDWKALGGELSLSSPGYGDSQYAYKVSNRYDWNGGLEHALGPLRCLEEGTTWSVSFKARLEDEVTGKGLSCDASVDEYTDCPLVWLRGIKTNGERFETLLRDNGMQWDENGWNTFRAHITITSDLLGPGFRSIRPVFAGGQSGSVLLMDDFAWVPTTSYPGV